MLAVNGILHLNIKKYVVKLIHYGTCTILPIRLIVADLSFVRRYNEVTKSVTHRFEP